MVKKTKYSIALLFSFIISGVGIYFYTNSGVAASSCTRFNYGHNRLVCYAKSMVGERENPAKSNKGTKMNRWNTSAGCSKGSAWCASFVSDMIRLGRDSTNVRTCSTAEMINKFNGKNGHRVMKFDRQKLWIGDVLYRTRPTGGHVAIVSSLNSDGSFETVEGNTACASVNNDCVRYRMYYSNGSSQDGKQRKAGVGNWEKILRW